MAGHPVTDGPQPLAPQRARALTIQDAINAVVRGLLRTPLLSAAVGRRLLTLYVVGRTSGRRYPVPVAYTRDSGGLLIGTLFAWGRNLRTGEPVEIRLQGRLRRADVTVYSSEADVTRAWRALCRDNRQFATFNKVSLDAAGNPDPEDLHLAWMAGARAFRLTPR